MIDETEDAGPNGPDDAPGDPWGRGAASAAEARSGGGPDDGGESARAADRAGPGGTDARGRAADPDESAAESWEFRLRQPPTALWPLLADTNRLFEALDMPRYTLEPDPAGADRPPIAHGAEGSRGLEWREEPYEWVAGQWWRFERRFVKGPLKRLRATLYLQRSLAGGSLVNLSLEAAPNGGIGRSLLSAGYLRRLGEGFQACAEHVDAFLSGEAGAPYPARPRPESRAIAVAVESASRALAASPYGNGAAGALSDLLCAAPDAEVADIRVRRLARLIDLSERATAELCLAAVSHGLMRLRLAVLCPRCRSVVAEAERFADLPERARCAADGHDFAVDLAVNVEALFSPAPEARPVPPGLFCASGPMTAPHVLIQQRLDASERRAYPFEPRLGGYRLRVQLPAVEPGPGDSVDPLDRERVARRRSEQAIDHVGGPFPVVVAAHDGVAAGAPQTEAGVVFENHTDGPVWMALERREWRADALTAAELAPLQAYRALFPGDAPAQPLRAGWAADCAFLVSERQALYARLGEPEAARRIDRLGARAAELARARNGGVLRLAGERALAAFVDPLDAARFALELREAATGVLLGEEADGGDADAFADGVFAGDGAFPDYERARARGPRIACGAAAGRAMASARQGRLEYLGYAAALAERLSELAGPGEIAVARDLAEAAGVASLLAPCRLIDDALDGGDFGPVEHFVRAGAADDALEP